MDFDLENKEIAAFFDIEKAEFPFFIIQKMAEIYQDTALISKAFQGVSQAKQEQFLSIVKKLSECNLSSPLTIEESADILPLLQEGTLLLQDHCLPEDPMLFQWYICTCKIYLKMWELPPALELARKGVRESIAQYGAYSGTRIAFQLLFGYLQFMYALFQTEYAIWPACKDIFDSVAPFLEQKFGEDHPAVTWIRTLQTIADVSHITLEEYTDTIWEMIEEERLPKPLPDELAEFLETLDYYPEEIREYAILEVLDCPQQAVLPEQPIPLGTEQESAVQTKAAENIPAPAADRFAQYEPEPVPEEEPFPEIEAIQEENSSQSEESTKEESSQQEEMPITFAQMVQDLMKAYPTLNLYTAYTGIPEKKLKNALASYADDPKGELIPYILILYDATVFGNAKNGFMMASNYLLLKEPAGKPKAIPVEELLPFTHTKKNEFAVNTKSVGEIATFADIRAENTITILNRILKQIQE